MLNLCKQKQTHGKNRCTESNTEAEGKKKRGDLLIGHKNQGGQESDGGKLPQKGGLQESSVKRKRDGTKGNKCEKDSDTNTSTKHITLRRRPRQTSSSGTAEKKKKNKPRNNSYTEGNAEKYL